MNGKNKYIIFGILAVIAVMLLGILLVRNDNKEEINETVLAEGTEILNNWLEEHPDIQFERLYGVGLHKFYNEKYDRCASNAIQGYLVGPEDKFQGFIFNPESEEMYLYVEDLFRENLISYLKNDYFMCDEKDELSFYFTSNIQLTKMEKKGILKKNLVLSDAVSSENSYVKYEVYDLYQDNPEKFLEDNDYEVIITARINNDIEEYIEPAVDLFYGKKNIDRLCVERNDESDSSFWIYYDELETVSYSYTYINRIDYSSNIQLKFENDIHEDAINRESLLERINSFRDEVDNNPPNIKITLQNDGMDIVIDNNPRYELYFSSDKFLEGRKLYRKDWNEEEICYDFIEVNNGRYPYALCEKGKSWPKSIYQDEIHFDIR